MLCNLVLNELNRSLKVLPFDAGREFNVIAVSFDPRETPALAAEKKKNYVKDYNRPGAESGWHFLTGEEANIRRLADSGVVFNRAYTAAPVCSPSRTAMLSGVRPWQSGLYDNGLDTGRSAALQKATPLPEVFKAAGYYTASYGKVGHGWELRKVWDDYVPHKSDPIPPGAPFLPFTRGEQDWGPTHLAEEDMNDSKYADAAIRQLGKKHDRPCLIA